MIAILYFLKISLPYLLNSVTPLFGYIFSGGAGGKGTWGKLGCELELPWVDPNDPNYESDGDDNIANEAPVHLPTKNGGQNHGPNGNVKSHGHGTTLKTMVPEMSEEDVNKGNMPLL